GGHASGDETGATTRVAEDWVAIRGGVGVVGLVGDLRPGSASRRQGSGLLASRGERTRGHLCPGSDARGGVLERRPTGLVQEVRGPVLRVDLAARGLAAVAEREIRGSEERDDRE